MSRKRNTNTDKYRRTVSWVLTVIWAAVITICSSIPGSGMPQLAEEWYAVGHFCEYLILGMLLVSAIDMPVYRGWKTAVIALLIASAYGLCDETHQWFVDGRVFDVADWVVDTLGGAMGALAGTWILTMMRLYRKDDV